MASTDPSTGTEIVLMDGTKTVVSPEFAQRFPGLAPDEEMLELLEANLGDGMESVGARNFKRVKVPNGEVTSWLVPRGGEDVAMKEITGILVAWKPRRSYWVSGEPDGSQPDCFSIDNKHPVAGGLFSPTGAKANLNPTGKCANCPMSQFGSDGRGAACKEQRLLFITTEGALFPLMVTAPRTSINAVTEFMLDLMDQRLRYWQVEVGLKLTPDKNKDGQAYCKIAMRVIRKLDEGEALAAKVYGNQIKDMVEAMLSSFGPADIEAGDGGYSVGEPAPAS
jgi:hypothetical protein